MKCISIIFAVFVVGLLSCIFAKSISPNKKQLLEDIPEHMNLNSNEEFFKQKCYQNGGLTILQNAMEARNDIITCLNTNVNGPEMMFEYEKTKAAGEISKFYKKYCGLYPTVRKCWVEYDAAVAPCFNEQERDEIGISQNVTVAIFDSICANSASSITQFDEAGGFEFISTNRDALSNCVMKYRKGVKMVDSRFAMFFSVRLVDPEDCNIFTKIQDCLVEELQVSEDPIVSASAVSFFNDMLRVTPCDYRLKHKGLQASDESSSESPEFTMF